MATVTHEHPAPLPPSTSADELADWLTSDEFRHLARSLGQSTAQLFGHTPETATASTPDLGATA